MLHGLRWQLLALVAALGLFLVVVLSRPSGGETIYVTANPPVSTDAPPADAGVPTNETGEIVSQPRPQPSLTVAVAPSVVSTLTDDVPTYREALVGRVGRINPLLANLNPVDADLTALIFEGLTKINEYGEPIPSLAQSWVISGDGLEYVFYLRQDIRWQDGQLFTAADVAFTMSLLRAPDFPGDRALYQFWRTVETQVLDPYTVRFRITQPLGSFLEALRIGILPAHALQNTPPSQLALHPFNLSPIGTGAYQLEALRSYDGQRIDIVDLRVAPNYRLRPEGQTGYALERVSFYVYDTFDLALQALQQGQVDGLAARDRAERVPLLSGTQNSAISIHNGIAPVVGTLIYNWTHDDFRVFREQRVRLALQTGLNRDSLVERNLNNLAIRADSPLLFNSWAYAPDLPWSVYDISRARELLSSAKLELTAPQTPTPLPDGVTPEPMVEIPPTPSINSLFSFAILVPNDPALVGLAQEIANQWMLLNIAVRVDAVDAATYRTRLEAHNFQAAIVELSKEGSADPDVYGFWHQGQYPNGKNYGGADDRAISELLEKARRDPFGINRVEEYKAFQEVFIERAIAIPLYYPLYTYAIDARVQNVHLGFIGSPSDRFLTIQTWKFIFME